MAFRSIRNAEELSQPDPVAKKTKTIDIPRFCRPES